MNQLEKLRKRHPNFVFQKFTVKLSKDQLIFKYWFLIEPNLIFTPIVKINIINPEILSKISPQILNNLAFHLGLAEIPSYWKAACSPNIIINAGKLSSPQINWWNNLLIKGLGEFFYTNKIDFTKKDFVNWQVETNPNIKIHTTKLSQRTLVPIGGGKDSVVTLEVLKSSNLSLFNLNPSAITHQIFSLNDQLKAITVERNIDPKLLELNNHGYLNGHTPFSSYLAFLSVTCAILFDYKYIAVSNESSSNEANVKYLHHQINHQYSKSYEFEKLFTDYTNKYLSTSVNYFSFLRPLYELQISRIFSQFTQYFSVIRSCNSTTSTQKWCCHCPKCLFVFASLYPFVTTKQIIKMFSFDLFQDLRLKNLAFEFMGYSKHKPFECIGTIEESKVAFYLCIKKHKSSGSRLPALLKTIEKKFKLAESGLEQRSKTILSSWSHEHHLPSEFKQLLKNKYQQ